MLTLSLSSVPTPTVTTIPSATYTYEVGGATPITLICESATTGVAYQWKRGTADL